MAKKVVNKDFSNEEKQGAQDSQNKRVNHKKEKRKFECPFTEKGKKIYYPDQEFV